MKIFGIFLIYLKIIIFSSTKISIYFKTVYTSEKFYDSKIFLKNSLMFICFIFSLKFQSHNLISITIKHKMMVLKLKFLQFFWKVPMPWWKKLNMINDDSSALKAHYAREPQCVGTKFIILSLLLSTKKTFYHKKSNKHYSAMRRRWWATTWSCAR